MYQRAWMKSHHHRKSPEDATPRKESPLSVCGNRLVSILAPSSLVFFSLQNVVDPLGFPTHAYISPRYVNLPCGALSLSLVQQKFF